MRLDCTLEIHVFIQSINGFIDSISTLEPQLADAGFHDTSIESLI